MPRGKRNGVGDQKDTTGPARGKPARRRAAEAGPRTRAPRPAPQTAEPLSPAAAEEQLRQVAQELVEARRLLDAVPHDLGDFCQGMRELLRQAPEASAEFEQVERRSRELRQQLQEARRECRETQEKLGAVRQQTAEIRERLDELERSRHEAEQRSRDLRAEAAQLRQHAREATGPAEPRNRLGVTVAPGVVVAEVLPETPAARAGLEQGDVIETVNGAPVTDGERLRQMIHQAPGGQDLELRVVRAGTAVEVRARLEVPAADAPPEAEGHNRFGVTVDPGVVVAEVLPESPAARAGLQHGDVIAAVNGTAVLNGVELRERIHHTAVGAEVVLEVVRGPERKEVKARLDDTAQAGCAS